MVYILITDRQISLIFFDEIGGVPPTEYILINKEQCFTREDQETKKETKKMKKITTTLLAIETLLLCSMSSL